MARPPVDRLRTGQAQGLSVVLATNNERKLAELRRIMGDAAPDVQVLGLADLPAYPEPVESERTFAGNALLKARAAADATGLPALADDSGLEVEVLNQMPGVRSARWAGLRSSDADNNSLLLRQLSDVPAPERTARFVCAMAAVLPNGIEHVRLGVMSGRLSEVPRGDNGFGYDPLFVADGYSVTNGELDPPAKDAISHRGQAVRAIVPVLIEELRRLAPAGQEG